MKVLVCGGMNFSDKDFVFRTLSAKHITCTITTIIHGGASGADTLADNWAFCNLVPVYAFPADWNTYGKGAGLIRNQRMLDQGKPDLVIAFPGGKGTADMVRRARLAGVTVFQTGWDTSITARLPSRTRKS